MRLRFFIGNKCHILDGVAYKQRCNIAQIDKLFSVHYYQNHENSDKIMIISNFP